MDGNKIGTLNDVQNCSANDVYEIVTLDNKKIYLPAIKDVIKKVDIAGRKMYVEIMKGLIWQNLLYLHFLKKCLMAF